MNPCHYCKLMKPATYLKQDSNGHNIYINDVGRRWSGLRCPDCVAIRQKTMYKPPVPKERQLISSNCSECSKEFIKKASSHQFCSIECSNKSRWRYNLSKRIPSICSECNNSYTHKRKFCSRQCRINNLKKSKRQPKKLITKLCLVCNSEFIEKDKNQRYCSRKCFSSTKFIPNKIKKKYHYPYVPKTSVFNDKSCGFCNNNFTTNIRTKRFCSLICTGKANRKRHSKQRRAYEKMRELKKKQRIPKWADKKKIVEIYKNKPEGMEVDHICPISGKNVSGLHVEYNLQYLSVKDNNLKLDKFDGTYENESWRKLKK